MKVECIRCLKNGRPGRLSWHATGRILVSQRKLPRAVIKCDVCGCLFTSGTREALDAAAAERGDCEVTPEAAPVAVVAPRPSLPIAAVPRQPQFATPAELAKSSSYARFIDRKRAAAGDE